MLEKGKRTDRLVSGITATGTLTIGNYIGAIKNFVALQDQYEMFIFVADLHAITLPIEPKTLRDNKKKIMALYLAAGLDPNKVVLFNQSDVLEHSQLANIVLTQTTMGELNRMTQFKDKSSKIKSANGTQMIPTGLYTYPTLMAADILLYNPSVVPVGSDQKQHLELTRNIAERMNAKFNTGFNIPEPIIPKTGAKIMSLTDPSSKMSKSSDNPKSYISLLDDPKVAAKKILSAVTDSENKVYFSKDKPGISNLLTIYSSFANISIKEAEKLFKDKNYKEFKETVAEVVQKFLINLQEKYNKHLKEVEVVATQGSEKARFVAKRVLAKVERKIGLK